MSLAYSALAASLLVFAAGLAYADKGSGQNASGGATASVAATKDAVFRGLDLNGDGLVTKAEAAGSADVIIGFDRADRNKDGKLSRAEYERLGRAKSKARAKAVAKAPASRPASAGATR